MVESLMGFPGYSDSKESACSAGDPGSVLELGSPGEGHDNLLQYSCLENSMDRGAWWATVHGLQRVGHHWETNAHTYKMWWALSQRVRTSQWDFREYHLLWEDSLVPFGISPIWVIFRETFISIEGSRYKTQMHDTWSKNHRKHERLRIHFVIRERSI